MGVNVNLILVLELLVTSVIFIIGAYLLQIISVRKGWNSRILNSTKTTLAYLSVIIMASSVVLSVIFT
jgi:hypothetical protein